MSSNEGIFILVILVACIFFQLPEKDIQEKSFYFSSCSNLEQDVNGCKGYINTIETKYKIFIREQMVVSNAVYYLDSDERMCKVFDKNNWRCQEKHGSTISSNEGRFYSSSQTCINQETLEEDIICRRRFEQISWMQYKWRRLKGFFGFNRGKKA